MIDRVTIGAWPNDDGVWTVRVSYADTDDRDLFPPQRFWRGSRGQGPGPGESIAEVIFFIIGELSNINYGPDLHGESDPQLNYRPDGLPASWAAVELEE